VLCDADLSHLGSSQYTMHSFALRQELEKMQGLKVESDYAWWQLNIQFMKTHHYFTEYGKHILEGRKRINMNKLMKQLHTRSPLSNTLKITAV
jgi:hypothetical protein